MLRLQMVKWTKECCGSLRTNPVHRHDVNQKRGCVQGHHPVVGDGGHTPLAVERQTQSPLGATSHTMVQLAGFVRACAVIASHFVRSRQMRVQRHCSLDARSILFGVQRLWNDVRCMADDEHRACERERGGVIEWGMRARGVGVRLVSVVFNATTLMEQWEDGHLGLVEQKMKVLQL